MNALSSPLLPPPPLQELLWPGSPTSKVQRIGVGPPLSAAGQPLLAASSSGLRDTIFSISSCYSGRSSQASLPAPLSLSLPGSELLRASAPAHFSSQSSCTWTPTSLSISCVLTMSIFLSLALGFFEPPNSYPAAYLAYLHVFLSSGHLELNRSKLSYWFPSLKLHLAQFSPNE